MSEQQVQMIPIAEIRVVNPRSRNRMKWESITSSIGNVGLKKPITVYQRELEDDGTRYDLVFGQGRMEAVRSLGDPMIPALITQAPEDERYLMSLIENLARNQSSTTALMVEIRRLRALKDSPKAIALKLGMERSYISGIINLVEHGEQDLIGRVEAGRLPLDAAIAIANGEDADIQNALCEAYDNGTLRGKRLEAIRCLLRQRKEELPPMEQGRVTSADLVKAYQQNTEQQRALMRRLIVVTERLEILSSSMRRLLADDHFLMLLRAEGLRTMPEFFNTRIAADVEINRCP